MGENQHRAFGKIRRVVKRGRDYLEASYQTPPEARAKNPKLPRRVTKTMRPEHEPMLKAWLAEAEKQILLDAWEDPTVKRVEHKADTTEFVAYAHNYIDTHTKADGTPIAPTTRAKNHAWVNNHLAPTFTGVPVSAISSKMVKDWWNAWPIGDDGKGKIQRWNTYTLFKAIMNHAASQPVDDAGHTLIMKSPCTLKVTRPRTEHEAKIAEYSELETIAAHMPSRLAIAIYLGGVVGLREGEICALTREDIDLAGHRVRVNKSVKQVEEQGKSRRLFVGSPKTESSYRQAPYPEQMQSLLVYHLDAYVGSEPDSLIITSERRKALIAPQTLRNEWYKALKSVPRLKGMHFHDLRHTALTHWGEAGASLAQLMEIAGHSELKTVARYQQISLAQREKAAANLNQRLSTPEEKEHKETPAEADKTSTGVDPLVSVLAALAVDQQASVLTSLDPDRQASIISQLTPSQQVTLLPRLLAE